MSSELAATKRQLLDALEGNTKIYFGLMKSWFTYKLSKEDFDHQARKLVPLDKAHLHNQFLLEIFARCQQADVQGLISGGAAKTAPKLGNNSANLSTILQQIKRVKRQHDGNALLSLPLVSLKLPSAQDKRPGFASRDLLLPDTGMMQGRALVVAWEQGLDDVGNDVISLLITATLMQLRTILTKAVSRRQPFKLREQRFRYGFGSQSLPSALRQCTQTLTDNDEGEVTTSFVNSGAGPMPAFRPNYETANRDAALELISGAQHNDCSPITLFDLLEMLQLHKSCIPSHAMYALTIERIISRLWHPTSDDPVTNV